MAFHHLYLARFLSKSVIMKYNEFIELAQQQRILSLESFWDKSTVERVLKVCPGVSIFLDSGAYTMITKKVEDVYGYIDSYIKFIHKYQDRFMVYANVDDISDSEESWRRQKYMEEHGVKPLPVYHFGEDFKWFEKYVNEYNYIAVGGLASGAVSSIDLKILLDRIFEYMYKKDLLSIKLHGFALFSVPFLLRYPWYSSDATTWLLPAAYGKVFIPRYSESLSEHDYCKIPTAIRVSEQGLYQESSQGDVHYTLEYIDDKKMVNRIEQYFQMIGVDKELLKTSYHEREKVMVHFYENFAKRLCSHTPTFRLRKSFFI